MKLLDDLFMYAEIIMCMLDPHFDLPANLTLILNP
jgi:hypothetical protein